METSAFKSYNPFANTGNIIYGEQFVGRQEAIATIHQLIIDPPQPGCLAVVGAPRIGKSSLVYHALIYPQAQLLAQKILAFRINLPDVSSLAELFQELVRQTLEVLDDADLEDESLSMRGKALLSKEYRWQVLQNEVRKFFKKIKAKGWRVVAILDEFDEARYLFKDGAGFQALRELNYQPAWRIYFVTVSRRSLPEITSHTTKDISNFPGIFKSEFLGCFTDAELETLYQKLEPIGLQLDRQALDLLWEYTGGHPFLASAIAFEIAKQWLEQQKLDIETALQCSMPEFLKYYDNVSEILQEDGSLEKLLQILFGPVITATSIDSETFQKYGLLKRSETDYTAFSDHFSDYLRLIERSIDLWPLWRDTEKELRLAIDLVMQKVYGEGDWNTKLEKARSNLKDMIDKCRTAKAKEEKSFGGRASANLLDFTYPADLFAIISTHWKDFEPIFKHDKKYWADCFDLLTKLRNPMAHFRDGVIEAYDRQKAEGYCLEIRHLIKTNLLDHSL